MLNQNLESLSLVSMHPTAARTATGQGTSVDLKDFDGDLLLLLDSSVGTGTSPTLDVTLEESSDDSTFTALSGSAFSQVTDSSASQQKLAINKDAAKRYVRVKYTLGGTTPSFTFSVNAVAAPKYG